jgi:hypothetical protein
MARTRWTHAAALFGALALGFVLSTAAAQEPAAPAPVPVAEAPAGPAPVEPAAEAETVIEEPPSPWSPGLLTSLVALSVGGISAVLGIWIDRDKSRPVAFAGVMSVLIIAAITVGGAQSYLDAEGAIQQRADLKRMLDMVNEIAVSSGDQKLADLVASEGGPKVIVPKLALPPVLAPPPVDGTDPADAAGEPVDAPTPDAAPAAH